MLKENGKFQFIGELRFRDAVRLPFSKGKEDRGAARRRQGQRPSGGEWLAGLRQPFTSSNPRGSAQKHFHTDAQRGGGVKVLLRYFLTEKVTKRLHRPAGYGNMEAVGNVAAKMICSPYGRQGNKEGQEGNGETCRSRGSRTTAADKRMSSEADAHTGSSATRWSTSINNREMDQPLQSRGGSRASR